MKKRLFFLCVVCCLLFTVVLYLLQTNKNAVQTIKYFPLNETFHFTDATTNLSFNQDNAINWAVASTTEKAMYLRHDLSLLYENGYFKGVQSKWIQNKNDISMAQVFPIHEAGLLQAISFHHGEIHQSPNQITSIQQMTSEKLYTKKQSDKFKQVENDSPFAIKFDQQIKDRLMHTWRDWLSYYNIDEKKYQIIPFSNMVNYQEKPLPGMSDDYSKEVIGKLWEGIYKNYILRLKEKQNQGQTHIMPIILLSKDKSHLYVIFELNNQREILLQQIETKES